MMWFIGEKIWSDGQLFMAAEREDDKQSQVGIGYMEMVYMKKL